MTLVSKHQAVMEKEVLELLSPHSGRSYLDATFGGGGHSRALLEASAPSGKVTGIDRDPVASGFATLLEKHYPTRFAFQALPYHLASHLNQTFDGVVMDLGISSDQLEAHGRGFSFQRNEPLDLRFDSRHGQTAAQFLQGASLARLIEVFQNYAQDRHAKSLAHKIIANRRQQPIATTEDFIAIIRTRNPKVLAPLWQALRIEVNGELEHLKEGLAAVSELLRPNGVVAVITFHSLEDKIVKDFFRQSQLELLTKKPIEPSTDEIKRNIRSRSAKLRAARKVVSN